MILLRLMTVWRCPMFDSERDKEIFPLCLDSAIISDVFLYWNVHHVEIHWEKNNYYVVLCRENSHTLFFVLCLALAFHSTISMKVMKTVFVNPKIYPNFDISQKLSTSIYDFVLLHVRHVVFITIYFFLQWQLLNFELYRDTRAYVPTYSVWHLVLQIFLKRNLFSKGFT